MKSIVIPVLATGILTLGFSYSEPARAAAKLTCEQGAPGSWKVCEAMPEGYPKYIWTVSGGGIMDPYVCTSDSNLCTAFCMRGSTSGFLHVSIYNSSNQLVGSTSKSLGCVSGS